VLLDVIRGQFHLIQEWLRPLAAEAQGQGREVERLRTAIEQVVVQYEKLKTELGE
jgi:archaellum component FlaC